MPSIGVSGSSGNDDAWMNELSDTCASVVPTPSSIEKRSDASHVRSASMPSVSTSPMFVIRLMLIELDGSAAFCCTLLAIVGVDARVQPQPAVEPVALHAELERPERLRVERRELLDAGREAAEESARLEAARHGRVREQIVVQSPFERQLPGRALEVGLVVGRDERDGRAVREAEPCTADEAFLLVGPTKLADEIPRLGESPLRVAVDGERFRVLT